MGLKLNTTSKNLADPDKVIVLSERRLKQEEIIKGQRDSLDWFQKIIDEKGG